MNKRFLIHLVRTIIQFACRHIWIISSTVLVRRQIDCSWSYRHFAIMCQFSLFFLRSRLQFSVVGNLRIVEVCTHFHFQWMNTEKHFQQLQGNLSHATITPTSQRHQFLLHGILHSFVPENALQRKIERFIFVVPGSIYVASA